VNKDAPVVKEEKKALTPQQLQKRKKMVIFPLLFLLFAGSMWLIFAPSGDKSNEPVDGFNTELPDPNKNGIISDKREAYLQEAMQSKQQAKMQSLQDFAFQLGEESEEERIAREERQLRMAPKPVEYYENPEMFERNYSSSRSVGAIQSSATAYQDLNRQLGSFYEEPATEVDEQAELELQWRVQELERQLAEEQARKSSEDEQLRLIEKSYEIASRYMNTGQQTIGNEALVSQVATASPGGKVTVQPVTQVRHNVVSLLSAPMSDEEFMEEFVKPRNWGFNTAAGGEDVQDKNSISASIYKTVTITDGQEVELRLLEPMRAGNVYIPENTVITGSVRITGERMTISISAVQYAGNVIPVELQAHDLDGGQGVYVPGSEEINAAKEIAANMGSSMGSSITITDDAGSQLLADLGRSAIQGTSQFISKKMRTVKVTLKAGYKVLLLPPMK
jgi:conjugative transposon TraM protein